MFSFTQSFIQALVFVDFLYGRQNTISNAHFTVGYFIVRIDFLSSLQGEQTVRTLPKTNQMLQRLLKSMPKPSRRYVHESIPTKLRVKS